MTKKIALVASLLVAFGGAVQAQTPDTTTCSCNSAGARTATPAALANLLNNKMVCGNVGSEKWQEWHNGSTSGPIVDYKLGPTHTIDPSTQVGSFRVNDPQNTVTYTYTGGGSYTYDVCYIASSNNYTFCGASYGGRNITGVRIGGAGLSNCDNISVTAPSLTTTRKR